jgi:hypothetical protein
MLILTGRHLVPDASTCFMRIDYAHGDSMSS